MQNAGTIDQTISFVTNFNMHIEKNNFVIYYEAIFRTAKAKQTHGRIIDDSNFSRPQRHLSRKHMCYLRNPI